MTNTYKDTDCGAQGKMTERAIKTFLGLADAVSAQGKTDFRKARVNYEVKTGSDDYYENLTASIDEELSKIGDKYEIIAGERRYKASVLAGLKKVPAIIKNTDDNTSAEIALLENLQRKNLTPIEEAQSFNKLLDRGFTQEEIAKKLGISQSTIINR